MSAIVCFVRSFSALNAVWYTIQRSGTPKAQGGSGVTWTCTCPDYVYRSGPKGKPCKHLNALYQCARVGVLPDNPEKFKPGPCVALLYPKGDVWPIWPLSVWRQRGRPAYVEGRGPHLPVTAPKRARKTK